MQKLFLQLSIFGIEWLQIILLLDKDFLGCHKFYMLQFSPQRWSLSLRPLPLVCKCSKRARIVEICFFSCTALHTRGLIGDGHRCILSGPLRLWTGDFRIIARWEVGGKQIISTSPGPNLGHTQLGKRFEWREQSCARKRKHLSQDKRRGRVYRGSIVRITNRVGMWYCTKQ